MSALALISSALAPATDVAGTFGEGLKLTHSRTTSDEVYGHPAYRNSGFVAPSHLLAWCRLDELNTNSHRAIFDKFQNLGSAP